MGDGEGDGEYSLSGFGRVSGEGIRVGPDPVRPSGRRDIGSGVVGDCCSCGCGGVEGGEGWGRGLGAGRVRTSMLPCMRELERIFLVVGVVRGEAEEEEEEEEGWCFFWWMSLKLREAYLLLVDLLLAINRSRRRKKDVCVLEWEF